MDSLAEGGKMVRWGLVVDENVEERLGRVVWFGGWFRRLWSVGAT